MGEAWERGHKELACTCFSLIIVVLELLEVEYSLCKCL